MCVGRTVAAGPRSKSATARQDGQISAASSVARRCGAAAHVPAQPVAGLLVHPLVVRAPRAGEQRVRRGLGGATASMCSSSRRPSPRPCRSGATMSRPMSQSSPSQPAAHGADEAARERTTKWSTRRATPGPRPATRAARGCRAGLVGERLLHPARPLERQQLAGVGRAARARSRRRRAPGSGGSRSGRRSAVRRRAWSWRQAAIAAWSPESSTVGHVEPAPGRRLGVDGVLQQPGGAVRLLGQRLGVAHETRQQPYDGLGDRERGDLAAVEHVVAERDLAHLRGGGVVHHPLVDALVAAAGEDQVLAARQLLGHRLGERPPLGVGTTSVAARRRPASSSSASPHGSGFITMPAPPPYGVSSTVWCRSWVQRAGRGRARSSSPLSRALPASDSSSGARYSGKIVTTSMRTPLVLAAASTQTGPVGDLEPAAGEVDHGHQRLHERHQDLAPSGADGQQVLAGGVDHLGHLAERRRRRWCAASPTSWWS